MRNETTLEYAERYTRYVKLVNRLVRHPRFVNAAITAALIKRAERKIYRELDRMTAASSTWGKR